MQKAEADYLIWYCRDGQWATMHAPCATDAIVTLRTVRECGATEARLYSRITQEAVDAIAETEVADGEEWEARNA